jgi:hypothetical protein
MHWLRKHLGDAPHERRAVGLHSEIATRLRFRFEKGPSAFGWSVGVSVVTRRIDNGLSRHAGTEEANVLSLPVPKT